MAPRPRKPPPIERYFGEGYFQLYSNLLLADEQTDAELDFLLRRLRPRRAQRWLDVPCAYGRHLRRLAPRRPDLRLYGADLNGRYLRAPALGSAAALAQCDFRRLPFADGSLHVVLNLLNSFGYYPPVGRRSAARPDDRAVLAEFRRILRPGGCLVMDLSNRRALVALVREQPDIGYAGGGYDAHERFGYDAAAQCLTNRTIWRWPGGEQRAGYRLRLYTEGQIHKLLVTAGFQTGEIYGDFTGSPFDPWVSERMLVFARRA